MEQDTPVREASATSDNSTVANVTESGEVVRTEAIESTPEQSAQNELNAVVQELADDSETGLMPSDYKGDLKKAVETSIEESDVAANAREKLKGNIPAQSLPTPKIREG